MEVINPRASEGDPAIELIASRQSPSSCATTLTRSLGWEWVALLFVLAVGAWRDSELLLRYPVAVGIDGYYYALQIEGWLGGGNFYSRTTAGLALYTLAWLSHFTGDTILAIKIGSLVFHGLLCLGVFALVTRVTRSAWLGVLGCALAALPTLHLYMVAEYIKNTGGLALLSLSVWAALRAVQTRRQTWMAATLVLFVLAAFSHRSVLAVASLLAVLALLSACLCGRCGGARSRRAALLAVSLMWCAPAVAAAQTFFALPVWLKRELSVHAKWPLHDAGLSEGLILLAVAPAVLLLLARSRPSRLSNTGAALLGAVALWSLLLTINPFLNADPGLLTISGRLGYLSYLQVALLLPGLLLLLRHVSRRAPFYAAALILPLTMMGTRAAIPYGLQPDYLTRRAALIQNLPAVSHQLGPSPLVIAPHGDQFVITFTLGIPAQQRLPQDDTAATIYWLMNGFECRAETPASVVMSEGDGGPCTVLIEDNELRLLLDSVPDAERRRLLAANPHFRKAHDTS